MSLPSELAVWRPSHQSRCHSRLTGPPAQPPQILVRGLRPTGTGLCPSQVDNGLKLCDGPVPAPRQAAPLRRDARRNCERLVRAVMAPLFGKALDVPLEKISGEAGAPAGRGAGELRPDRGDRLGRGIITDGQGDASRLRPADAGLGGDRKELVAVCPRRGGEGEQRVEVALEAGGGQQQSQGYGPWARSSAASGVRLLQAAVGVPLALGQGCAGRGADPHPKV